MSPSSENPHQHSCGIGSIKEFAWVMSHASGGGVAHHDSNQAGTIERCVVSVRPQCMTCGASMNTLLSVSRHAHRGPGGVSFLTVLPFLTQLSDS